MNNGLLIALAVFFVFILLAINIYLLALYVHSDDKGFGTALYCKVLVVLGLTLCQAQALMVPLDVANVSALDSSGIDMKSFWYFLYSIVIIFVCLLLPFALFFYQTDQDDGYCKRFGNSLLYTFLANIVSILLLFISWNFLKYVDLPVHSVAAGKSTATTTPAYKDIVVKQTDLTLTIQSSFAVYIIAIMSFFGWVFVVICGGVGLSALPIDAINQFRYRPKAQKSADMKQKKQNLVDAIANLVKQGEQIRKLDEDNSKNDEAGFFSKWSSKRQVNNRLTQFKAKYYSLQQQFDIFNLQLKFSDSNPIVPILKLIIGIVFLITSLMWVLQIIFGSIAKGTLGRPLIPFMNQWLISMDNANAGFLSTFVFAYLCLYILWCVQKGTVKFGMRIPCLCRFHPMKQNQTWMNSFLFNVIVMLIASVGVIQLCISSFPTYTRNTQIYMIIGLQLNYMRFYSIFYQKTIFHIALIVWFFLTTIYQCMTCNNKPAYMKEIDRIRNNNIKDDDD